MTNPHFPRLVITGHARHGKDTACEIISKHFNVPWVSSSRLACNIAIWPMLMPHYPSREHCYTDRHNHRALWYELIKFYNKDDKARLASEIFKSHNIYCGLRNIEELNEARQRGLYDMSIWIDASKRLPPESTSSMTITRDDCSLVIGNNDSVEDFERELIRVITIVAEDWRDRHVG